MRTFRSALGGFVQQPGAAVCLPDFGLPKPADSSPSYYSRSLSNGRLYRVVGLLGFYVCSSSLTPAFADTTCPSYTSAQQQCQAAIANVPTNFPNYHNKAGCKDLFDQGQQTFVLYGYNDAGDGAYLGYFGYQCPAGWTPPAQPSTCAAAVPSIPLGQMYGSVVSGTVCQHNAATDPNSGVAISCTVHIQTSGPAWTDQYGNWNVMGSSAPTGDVCNWQPGQKEVADTGTDGVGAQIQSGQTPASAASVPVPPAPPSTKACGGASCYNPSNDTYTAKDSNGNNMSLPGSTANQPDGGCTSTSTGSLCAGARIPVAPTYQVAGSNISDPANEQTGSDHYGRYDSTNGVQTITVNTYGVQGAPTSSGASSGDQTVGKSTIGPSGQGDKDCTAGSLCNDNYADAACTSLPSTAGDPLLSGIAIDMHRQRCDADAAAVKASDFAGADRTLGDQTASPDQLFHDGADGSGSTNPLSALDTSGFLGGSRSCPGFQPIDYLGHNIVDDNGICQTGSILAGFVLAVGYALAAIIIYKGRAS